MKRRMAKRMTTVRWYSSRERRLEGLGPDCVTRMLIPQQWNRLRRFYDKSRWLDLDHENLGRRATVARRKPRAGRKRS